ncbi:hypothetical protein GNY06_05105 [Elizabethkingia argentiflava]|uniref:Uncharacterized protein n=1 Tax=Elizabethkingia argenteiflava TaxID=2681556 RepID=A0A845PV82_9FLAO|nr:hypothetical protein [Elizabethkingia argenteiflava]NAW50786.1 hypothetical protein [Elizabethkingia argenteiflava]
MHKFWYHSPVRFYNNASELEDMRNPQNTQFFGVNQAYPLDIGEFHRFQIPNTSGYEVNTSNLLLWLNGSVVPAQFGIDDGRLRRVTFKSYETTDAGRFEIKDLSGKSLFFSNCVQFVDSRDHEGRRYVRVATKHYYNRHLFSYQTVYDWMVTNLPAYCLGDISVEVDVNTVRTGNSSSLRMKDSYIDEIVTYQFSSLGDGNILNFIEVHATNNLFFIDGTQRIMKDKLDREDFSMFGKLKLLNVKNYAGLNVLLDEEEIFEDVLLYTLSDDKNRPIEFKDNILIEIKDE